MKIKAEESSDAERARKNLSKNMKVVQFFISQTIFKICIMSRQTLYKHSEKTCAIYACLDVMLLETLIKNVFQAASSHPISAIYIPIIPFRHRCVLTLLAGNMINDTNAFDESCKI